MIGIAVRGMSRHPRPVRWAAVLIPLAAAVWIPQMGSSFYTSLAINVLIFGLLAMSLDLLAGYTGLVSLGHASYLGVGAYGIAFGMSRGMSADASIGLAMAVVLLTALVFGLVAVRVREITFVILTLALGQIVWGLAYRWVSVSGGDNGLPIGGRPVLGPLDLTGGTSYYYFVLVVFVICAVILWMIVRSVFGLTLRGIRGNEPRMRTLGYNTWLHKYLAFVISGVFGGIAGVLFGFYNLYVSPTTIDFSHNGQVVLMVVMGGLGTLWGPLVGAGVIVLLQQYVSIYVTRWVTVLGIIFVLTVLFARDGLWGAFMKLLSRLLARGGGPPMTAVETENLVMTQTGVE
ncbi:MAG: branched-chain amino acid ABC transporter permease [Candidatus Dormibacteraceae bacterium]